MKYLATLLAVALCCAWCVKAVNYSASYGTATNNSNFTSDAAGLALSRCYTRGLQSFVAVLASKLPIVLGNDSITQTTRTTLDAFGSADSVADIYHTLLLSNTAHLLAPTWYDANYAANAVAVTDAASRVLLGYTSTHNGVLYESLYGLATADDFAVAARQLVDLLAPVDVRTALVFWSRNDSWQQACTAAATQVLQLRNVSVTVVSNASQVVHSAQIVYSCAPTADFVLHVRAANYSQQVLLLQHESTEEQLQDLEPWNLIVTRVANLRNVDTGSDAFFGTWTDFSDTYYNVTGDYPSTCDAQIAVAALLPLLAMQREGRYIKDVQLLPILLRDKWTTFAGEYAWSTDRRQLHAALVVQRQAHAWRIVAAADQLRNGTLVLPWTVPVASLPLTNITPSVMQYSSALVTPVEMALMASAAVVFALLVALLVLVWLRSVLVVIGNWLCATYLIGNMALIVASATWALSWNNVSACIASYWLLSMGMALHSAAFACQTIRFYRLTQRYISSTAHAIFGADFATRRAIAITYTCIVVVHVVLAAAWTTVAQPGVLAVSPAAGESLQPQYTCISSRVAAEVAVAHGIVVFSILLSTCAVLCVAWHRVRIYNLYAQHVRFYANLLAVPTVANVLGCVIIFVALLLYGMWTRDLGSGSVLSVAQAQQHYLLRTICILVYCLLTTVLPFATWLHYNDKKEALWHVKEEQVSQRVDYSSEQSDTEDTYTPRKPHGSTSISTSTAIRSPVEAQVQHARSLNHVHTTKTWNDDESS